MLGGTRAILYFGARGNAGLTHALIVVVAEIVFRAAAALGVTGWYDRRRLDAFPPTASPSRQPSDRIAETSLRPGLAPPQDHVALNDVRADAPQPNCAAVPLRLSADPGHVDQARVLPFVAVPPSR